ncbi:MAG: DEAD/DEAH box helicase, partial [Muribaculaceae bacterium]|nr:DEAD/DEAH box helicase [Muribaculaceae bacterium]
MDIRKVKAAILAMPGVEALNAMQQKMMELAASQVGTTILLAPTGSGKTMAFAIPLLSNVKPKGGLQAIVMAPSRELVLQIAEVIRTLASPEGIKTTVMYGGHPFKIEQQSLSVTPDIIISTPGRLLDHIKRESVDVATTRTLVIDEYDKSLELGFEDEMRRIVRRLTALKRLVLTSATPLDALPAWLPKVAGKTETLSFG